MHCAFSLPTTLSRRCGKQSIVCLTLSGQEFSNQVVLDIYVVVYLPSLKFKVMSKVTEETQRRKTICPHRRQSCG